MDGRHHGIEDEDGDQMRMKKKREKTIRTLYIHEVDAVQARKIGVSSCQ